MYSQKLPDSLLCIIIDESIICRAVAHLHDTYVGSAIMDQLPLYFLQDLKQRKSKY